MHPPPPAYHGRSNVPSGPKPAPTPLPMQSKPPLMATTMPTAIQQRGLPPMQPKTILKHPSQYKPTVSQPQIQQQQQQPQTSQPPSLEAVKQPLTKVVQNSGSVGTLHSTTSQPHTNSMTGPHVVTAEKLKPTTTAAESECLDS